MMCASHSRMHFIYQERFILITQILQGVPQFFLALVLNLFWWSIEHLEQLGAVVVTRGAVLPRQFELLKSTKNANVLWIVLFTVHLFLFVLFCFHTHLLSKFSEKSQSVFTDFPCPVCAACQPRDAKSWIKTRNSIKPPVSKIASKE